MQRWLVAVSATVVLAACLGGGGFAWPHGMPKPKLAPDSASGTFRVYVWNRGLGGLTVRDSRGGGAVHVQPAETGVLHLYGHGQRWLVYGNAYRGGPADSTATSFTPTAEHPCWALVVPPAPQKNAIYPVPLPVDCPGGAEVDTLRAGGPP